MSCNIEIGNCNIEIGNCDICKTKDVQINRQYYYYDINCECCGGASKNRHFEIVYYCSNCKPIAPRKINANVKPINF